VLQTEHEFTLPVGYDAGTGELHRTGTMRLATAADELLPLSDPRVQRNEAYLVVILLARVVTRLGPFGEDDITPKTIEGLFAADLSFLEALYGEINRVDANGHRHVTCPSCAHDFELEPERLGGS
jgi:hypothetical protein